MLSATRNSNGIQNVYTTVWIILEFTFSTYISCIVLADMDGTMQVAWGFRTLAECRAWREMRIVQRSWARLRAVPGIKLVAVGDGQVTGAASPDRSHPG